MPTNRPLEDGAREEVSAVGASSYIFDIKLRSNRLLEIVEYRHSDPAIIGADREDRLLAAADS